MVLACLRQGIYRRVWVQSPPSKVQGVWALVMRLARRGPQNNLRGLHLGVGFPSVYTLNPNPKPKYVG